MCAFPSALSPSEVLARALGPGPGRGTTLLFGGGISLRAGDVPLDLVLRLDRHDRPKDDAAARPDPRAPRNRVGDGARGTWGYSGPGLCVTR